MRHRKILSLAALVAFLAACAPEPAEVGEANGADLILTNARVYTLDWGEPGGDALLDTEVVMTILGGRIRYRDGEIVR